MDRRNFVKLALTAGLAPAFVPTLARAAPVPVTLRAQAFSQQILPTKYAGPSAVLGFNGRVPGPELRVRQGAPLTVRLENTLDQGAAVHWHGVRLENAMDGVPGLTQPLVAPGAQFDYTFAPPDAGTYWYHSHYLSHDQVARGLMGPLIVEETQPVDVDHDITVILADWKFDPDGQLVEDFGNRHDVAHAGRIGNYAKAFLPDLTLVQGQRIRLRLINAAVDRIFPLILKGVEGKIVALDGMPLTAPRSVDVPTLAPAQRMDILADVTGPLEFELQHRDGTYPLGSLPTEGVTAARAAQIPALPPVELPQPARSEARTLSMTIAGGAMGAAHGGTGIWAFNDVSGMQDAPFARINRGETVQIDLINETRWPHGIHLHGHHFFEVAEDGTLGDFRDTTLLMGGAQRRILCVFDNPGKWMLHCHMLTHQFGGMKTWVEVV